MTQIRQLVRASLTLYLIETPFSTFKNIGDPDHAALVRASLTLYLIETPFNTFINRGDPDHAACKSWFNPLPHREAL